MTIRDFLLNKNEIFFFLLIFHLSDIVRISPGETLTFSNTFFLSLSLAKIIAIPICSE